MRIELLYTITYLSMIFVFSALILLVAITTISRVVRREKQVSFSLPPLDDEKSKNKRKSNLGRSVLVDDERAYSKTIADSPPPIDNSFMITNFKKELDKPPIKIIDKKFLPIYSEHSITEEVQEEILPQEEVSYESNFDRMLAETDSILVESY